MSFRCSLKEPTWISSDASAASQWVCVTSSSNGQPVKVWNQSLKKLSFLTPLPWTSEATKRKHHQSSTGPADLLPGQPTQWALWTWLLMCLNFGHFAHLCLFSLIQTSGRPLCIYTSLTFQSNSIYTHTQYSSGSQSGGPQFFLEFVPLFFPRNIISFPRANICVFLGSVLKFSQPVV